MISGLIRRTQRLAKWFTTLSPKDKAKIVKDVSQLVLARRTRMCNFLEYKGRSLTSGFEKPMGLFRRLVVADLDVQQIPRSCTADMLPSFSLPDAPPMTMN